jgi:hypothetical protein
VPRGASPAPSAIPAPAVSAITARRGIVEHYRGSTLTANVRPKLKLEVVVDDKDKLLVVETILKRTRTGEIGDGVFVTQSRKRSASVPARRARRSSRPTARREMPARRT